MCLHAGDSSAKCRKSPCTAYNSGAVSPSGGGTWRSPGSPVRYAYRTGWVPPASTPTRSTAAASPHHHRQHSPPSDNCVSVNAEEHHRTSSSSRTDVPAVVGRQPAERGSRTSNGHVEAAAAAAAVVNGCSNEFEVVGSSGPDRGDGWPGSLGSGQLASSGKCPEKRDVSSALVSFSSPVQGDGQPGSGGKWPDCPRSVDTAAVVSKSRGTVEAFPSEGRMMSIGSDARVLPSHKLDSSSAATTENNGTIAHSDHSAGPRSTVTTPADHDVQTEHRERGTYTLL